MSQKSLYDVILEVRNFGPGLSEAQVEALYDLLGKGCRQATKDRLWRRLNSPALIEPVGILRRLHVEPTVQYCAGQSYPDELRTVRDCVLGR